MQMFDIVADVERYPEFLPLCESLAVKSREALGDKTRLVATMGVGYKTLRETFTTQVLLKPGEPAIDVTYLDGPFHHLENRWRFLATPGGSEIDFFIEYAFKSPMLALLMGACSIPLFGSSAKPSKHGRGRSTARRQALRLKMFSRP